MGLHQIKFSAKWKKQYQNEKATCRTGENFYNELNQELISKIYKELIQLIHYKKIWFKNEKRRYTFVQMANEYMKMCLTLLIMRAIKMKTWMRYYLRPVKIMIIMKTRENKYWIARMWRKGNPCTLLVGL